MDPKKYESHPGFPWMACANALADREILETEPGAG